MSSDSNRPRPRSSKKQRARQGVPVRATATQRASAGPTGSGPGAPRISTLGLAVIAVVVFAVGAALAGGAIQFGGGTPSAVSSTNATAGASAGPSGPGGSVAGAKAGCPTAQPPAAGAGEKSVVTMETEKGQIQITLDADLSPIAVGNFAALAACGYYDGIVFHRVVQNFVIQGGDPTGTGTGGPGYTIKDEPVATTYSRGTVAMARSAGKDTVGSQFFIVLSDAARSALGAPQYNNYQIIGTVTSGMETADAIAAAAGSEELPTDPVVMKKVTISKP